MTPGISTDVKSQLLLDTMALCNLSQFNSILNKNGRYLDLVLCNINHITIYGGEPPTRENGHHPPLCVEIGISSEGLTLKNNSKCRKLNFNKSEYTKIRESLDETNWPELLSGKDVNEVVIKFYAELNAIISKYTLVASATRDRYPSWFSAELIRRLKDKNKYHKKFKKYGNLRDNDEFCTLRSLCKVLTKSCHASYISSI